MQRHSDSSSVPKMKRIRLLNVNPGIHQSLYGKQGGQQRPLVVLGAAAVEHAILLNRIEWIVLPILQLSGWDHIQVPQDAQHLSAFADLRIPIISTLAVAGTKTKISGDLQYLAQCLVDGISKGKSTRAFITYAGNAHQSDKRLLQAAPAVLQNGRSDHLSSIYVLR